MKPRTLIATILIFSMLRVEAASAQTPLRQPIQGRCECPYDLAQNGSRCGGRSAYTRLGGARPQCYVGDQ